MRLNFEYKKKLRVGFIGAGEHAYRNILPSFQYAPIDLVALADDDKNRGIAVARQFGARHFYPKHQAMLEKEEMDAVFIVLPPDENMRPVYGEIGPEVIRKGFHVWIDVPPCADKADVERFTSACMSSKHYVGAGLKRMFAPAYLKAKDIIDNDDSFGKVSSFSLRYPVGMPALKQRDDPELMYPFYEIIQPLSVLKLLFGEPSGFSFLRSGNKGFGDVVMNIAYSRGMVGTLHLTGNQSATSPLERLEVVGVGANFVVENMSRLTYYRSGSTRGEGTVGRVESFIGDDERAPIVWEPEMSLGQLYNKQLVLQGYLGCIRAFAEGLVEGKSPKVGNLVDLLYLMNFYDKMREAKEKVWVTPY